MQRLGKNQGRYQGEPIDIEKVLREIHRLAITSGWEAEMFYSAGEVSLYGYKRAVSQPRLNLYISSGIHGDEPSGPLAILQLLEENQWPGGIQIWLSPCLNPNGFKLNTRENENGVDLNRDYRSRRTPEVRAHIAWLDRQPKFNLSIALHEDWEANGFYVYEVNPHNRPSLAESIIEAVRELCPIEHAELVDNWECKAGIIRPQIKPEDRPQWAEAVYLIVNKTALGYTIETPSDFPLAFRVRTHVRAMHRIFELLENPAD
jgi:protein MpaA